MMSLERDNPPIHFQPAGRNEVDLLLKQRSKQNTRGFKENRITDPNLSQLPHDYNPRGVLHTLITTINGQND